MVELEVLPLLHVSVMTNNCWKGCDSSSKRVIIPQTTAGGDKTEMGGLGIGQDLQAQLRTPPGCKWQRVENLAKEEKEKGPVSLFPITISKAPLVPLEE